MTSAFFGLQMALELPRGDQLRDRLSEVVRELRGSTSVPTQRTSWTRASALLVEAIPTARLATWDLIREAAEAEYEDWASGLEAMALWPLADFGADGRYVLVSVIMLVTADSTADQTLGDVCDIPERDWLRRSTYQKLASAPPMLNFTHVLCSGMYLAPRPDLVGFSHAALTGEGFEYLDPVQD
ncbi:MAG: hypothetical protein H0V44_08715 [Planctomycetes bacterium]|nr:hypothetical protein [Planctomycetota bacterium]